MFVSSFMHFPCFILASLRLYKALLDEGETDLDMPSRVAYPVVG